MMAARSAPPASRNNSHLRMDSDTMTRHPPKEWRQSVLPTIHSFTQPGWIRLRLVRGGACFSLPIRAKLGRFSPLKGTPRRRHSTCDTDRASGTFTSFRGPILQTLIHAETHGAFL